MQQVNAQSYFTPSRIINILIALFIMFILPSYGSPEFSVSASEKLAQLGFTAGADGKMLISLTPVGTTVICIFLGLIYLWTFVDTSWPTFLALIALGISPFAPFNQTLSSFFGNPIVAYILFIFIFAGVFVRSQVGVYLARYLMTRDIVRGRPWVLVSMIFVSTYLVAFLDQTTSVFLMWPVVYTICREVGYKKGDRFVSFMIVGIIMMAMLSFATDAIKGGAFALVLVGNGLTKNPAFGMTPLDLGPYLALGFVVSIAIIIGIICLMRFVYRVDVSLLKTFDIDVLKANPLPPLNWKQKTTIAFFGVLALWMLTPSLLPTGNPIGLFISANTYAIGPIIILTLLFINIKGETITDLQSMMAGTPWNVFFLIAAAMLFGNSLTHPSTNFTIVLESVLKDLFVGFSYFQLTVVVVIMAIILTNFTNSVVTGLIFAPVLAPLCASMGYNATPLLVCFFYTVLIAGCTPAGSPYAALLFGNKEWIDTKDASHYAVVSSVVVVICVLLIGVPLAQFLF